MNQSKLACALALVLGSSAAAGAAPGDEWSMVVQQGHAAMVLDLAANGRAGIVASASFDNTAKLWNARGYLLRTLRGHAGAVTGVDIDPAGRFVATASMDGTLRLWRATDGEAVWTRSPGGADQAGGSSMMPARRVRFSPDGASIAVAFSNVHLVYGLDGSQRSSIPGGGAIHGSTINDLAFSPDGLTVATASDDGRIKLWKPSGELVRTIGDGSVPLTRIAWRTDGRFMLAGSGDGGISLFRSDGMVERTWSDLRSGRKPAFGELGPSISALVAETGGDGFTAASEDGSYAIVDGPTGFAVTGRIPGGMGIGAMTSLGDAMALGTFSSIGVMDRSGALALFPGARDAFYAVAANPKYDLVALGGFEGRVVVRSMEGKLFKDIVPPAERLPVDPASRLVRDIVFHPGGYGFALLMDKPLLMGIDGTFLGDFQNGGAPGGAWSPDGVRLFMPDSIGYVHVRDLKTGAWDMREPPKRDGRYPGSVAIVQDSLAAYAMPDGTILAGPRGGPYAELRGLIDRFSYGIDSLAFSPDGSRLAAMDDMGIVRIWDGAFRSVATFQAFDLDSLGIEPALRRRAAPDGTVISVPALEAMEYWDRLAFGKPLYFLKSRRIAFSSDGRLLATGAWDGTVRVWDAADGRLVLGAKAHDREVTGLAFSARDSLLFSVDGGCDVSVMRVSTGDRATLLSDGPDWILYTDDGYFDSSRNGGRLLSMVRGTRAAAPDQFAVASNRPDIVLGRLGIGSPERLETWRMQYRKRVAKLGLLPASIPKTVFEGRILAAADGAGKKALLRAYASRGAEWVLAEDLLLVDKLDLLALGPYSAYVEETLRAGRLLPEAEIVSSRQDGKYLDLECRVTAGGQALASVEIFVNDVPLYGNGGRKAAGSSFAFTQRIELCAGTNKVELGCRNSSSVESPRDLLYARWDGKAAGDLWFIGFGVSGYRDPKLALGFPAKDVRDLAAAFSAMEGSFGGIHVRTFVDRDCTPQNMAKAKDALRDAKVDDTVVLFISGHGMHSGDALATYYYLTWDADTGNLPATAAEFDLVEGILDGIAPRNKLFLIDTCESGELDEALFADYMKRSEAAGFRARTARGTTFGTAGKAVAPRTWLRDRDRFIWNDLNRRTGAVVFSSCGGSEFSYEPEDWSEDGNGFFTAAVLRALRDKAADADGDGSVGIEELRSFVTAAVAERSKGLQNPTIDRDNLAARISFPAKR
ncbi:MAG: caspase family protein [Spirochaetes bacterium]|nr:caspase family protein [Spirochaetota bacterium]